jgi:hypothetical protein
MIRGLSLVVMTIDHLPESPLYHLSYEPFGFFSAAHAFFFLSGWINGSQLGRIQAERGMQEVRRISHQRTRRILLSHSLTVVVIAFALMTIRITGWREYFPLFFDRPIAAVAGSISTIHSPGLLFILPCYFWFFLFVPLVLAQMTAGRTWLIAAVSSVLWGVAQFNLFTPPQDPTRFYTGHFNLAGWQAIFFAGLMLGRTYQAGSYRLPRITIYLGTAVLGLLFLWRHDGVVTSLAAKLHLHAWWNLALLDRFAPAVDVLRLGWLGLLDFMLFVAVLAALPRKTKDLMASSKIGKALTLLGQNSLHVFVWQVFLWFSILPFEHRVEALPKVQQALIVAAGVATLFVPAYVHSRFKERNRVRRDAPTDRSRRATECDGQGDMKSGLPDSISQIG